LLGNCRSNPVIVPLSNDESVMVIDETEARVGPWLSQGAGL
jgi:hypothetical protein